MLFSGSLPSNCGLKHYKASSHAGFLYRLNSFMNSHSKWEITGQTWQRFCTHQLYEVSMFLSQLLHTLVFRQGNTPITFNLISLENIYPPTCELKHNSFNGNTQIFKDLLMDALQCLKMYICSHTVYPNNKTFCVCFQNFIKHVNSIYPKSLPMIL